MMNEKISKTDLTVSQSSSAAQKQFTFDVASARAECLDIIKVYFRAGDTATESAVLRRAKQLKAQGKIVLYIKGSEYNTEDTQTRYLLDKLTWLSEDADLCHADDSLCVVYVAH